MLSCSLYIFKSNTEFTEKEKHLSEQSRTLDNPEISLKEREVALRVKEAEFKQMQKQLLQKQEDHDKKLSVMSNDKIRIIVAIFLFPSVLSFYFYPV